MGKIFTALNKYRRERGSRVSTRLKDSDYDLLLRFDENTGRLETDDPSATGHSGSFKRLMTYRLIDSNGRLTPIGRAKHRELRRAYEDRKREKPLIDGRPQQPPPQVERVSKTDKLSASEWAILMKYDRKSGNLLTYDPAAGRLDRNSSAILKDPTIIQRLIDTGMIRPGGWLTPKAKRECARIEQKLKTRQIKGFAKSETTVPAGTAARQSETLRQADLDVLLQSNPKTRKLDLNNPAVAKDPGIVRRLAANKMVTPDGRLTPKGLLNWQVLTRWTPEGAEKSPTFGGAKTPIAKKAPKAAEKKPPLSPAPEPDQNKVKITRFKKDESPVIEQAEQAQAKERPTPAVQAPPGAPSATGPREKDHLQRPGLAATAAGRSRSTAAERFSISKAVVGYNEKAIDPGLVSLLDPQSFEAEQFKILRTHLLFPESGKTLHSVMVTSALPGEGKSFVAANLAVSVARHVNWNVLLIDCDLRKPSVHRHFGFQKTPGLSNYLSRGAPLESLLLKTCVDNLTILPGGRLPDNPSEILSSDRMANLLNEVAARYDDRLIILDSPPPGLAAEAGALARLVDGIILVTKYGSTSRKIVRDLVDRLGRDKFLGAILNFDMHRSNYSDYYYRY
ncbi:MAG: polysaccharide biosynthesis tyrosine autokinase [Deltaproteobacteria bacterium]|nr:polysaccharide biosynthesis tyrosine autokinase [Deltaproteobacteria bacterium]